jgi:predicted ArsR family transcriptional regulator
MSAADIFAELDEYFTQEQRQPGDVSADDLARHYGINPQSAQRRMERLAVEQPETWRRLKVFDNGRERWILRKVVE